MTGQKLLFLTPRYGARTHQANPNKSKAHRLQQFQGVRRLNGGGCGRHNGREWGKTEKIAGSVGAELEKAMVDRALPAAKIERHT